MKQTASIRRRSRVALGVVVAVVAALAGVQAAFSAASVGQPTLTSTPPAVSSSRTATFTFTGPAKATFKCQLDGKGFLACTSPVTYASLADGQHQFQVTSVMNGVQSEPKPYVWTVDTVAPAAPTLTAKPNDPTSNATNDFAWAASTEPGLISECSLENASWFACTSPYRWVIGTSNYGQHQFAVRFRDAAGNTSFPAQYRFKYEKGLPTSGVPFRISGSVSDLTIGIPQFVRVTVTNPNPVTIFVSALRVEVAPDSASSSCSAADNIQLDQSNVSVTNTLTVPANSSVVLPASGVSAPRIKLIDLPTVNQEACKGASFTLTYSGTATN